MPKFREIWGKLNLDKKFTPFKKDTVIAGGKSFPLTIGKMVKNVWDMKSKNTDIIYIVAEKNEEE